LVYSVGTLPSRVEHQQEITMRILAPLALVALAACTAQQASTVNRIVAEGQLYCAIATANGPLVIALANAAGVPVTVTGKAAGAVAAACAVIGGIPVVPPPSPAAAPVVAAVV